MVDIWGILGIQISLKQISIDCIMSFMCFNIHLDCLLLYNYKLIN